ncbi:MAG TPA: hypothetical protein VH083_13805 [Myxococcales bacterium]|jgi:hypothetical protein|nr:hypothetical protein [Myxococcales bacterium]
MRRHYIAIAVILAVGWGLSAWLYVHGAAEDALPMELTNDAKLNVGRLERLAGHSAVIYEQINENLKSLFHGSNLGITLFVVTSVIALIYYLRITRAPTA